MMKFRDWKKYGVDIDREIDTIYAVVKSCLQHKEWKTLSKWFFGFLPQVKEMHLDIILAYLTSTKPAASKIRYRRQFSSSCKPPQHSSSSWIMKRPATAAGCNGRKSWRSCPSRKLALDKPRRHG